VGDCEDVESFAVPPTSDDQLIRPKQGMDPVLSGTPDTWRALHVSRASCLRAKKAVLSKSGYGSQVYALRRAAPRRRCTKFSAVTQYRAWF
jgi:hypothetical protein